MSSSVRPTRLQNSASRRRNRAGFRGVVLAEVLIQDHLRRCSPGIPTSAWNGGTPAPPTAARVILLAVAVRTEDKEFSLRTAAPPSERRSRPRTSRSCQENLVQFRLAGRIVSSFLTRSIFFLHCKLNHAVFLPFYRDVASSGGFHRHGKGRTVPRSTRAA